MEFKSKNPLIILIAGKARSGKSTVARHLNEEYIMQNKRVVISPYTKYLKLYIEEITKEKIDDNNKPRDLLQQISSKVIKGELKKENFFLQRQIEDIEIYSYFMDVILIPDVRFPKEIEEIKNKFSNVISIGIIRKDLKSDLTDEQQQDITETALDSYHNYDFEIENNEQLDLKEIVKRLVKQIDERRNIDE